MPSSHQQARGHLSGQAPDQAQLTNSMGSVRQGKVDASNAEISGYSDSWGDPLMPVRQFASSLVATDTVVMGYHTL